MSSLPYDEMSVEVRVVHFQISPVNNNISKSNFSSGAVTPPPAPVVSLPGSMAQGMGGAAFAGAGVAQAPVTSFAATPSFPRQQFPSSGMYGWY